ncbi:LysR substrate-binding domain-containing protein [Microbacterium hydrocarbonoxydans]|uniref:LysR substrate-binding domain-containing protein n=1 Tax=Microbacterium hydrocarbonoxydans TaxID=273678 RepID=UPI00203C43EC|nr:LysR substrate-binding domain-containing protein [Microbacterium hydrocarbonoxydans]MCM3779809.1 LysR substrate-binding domain-containing protein [Microbacterium hydrocarbonoxydans]
MANQGRRPPRGSGRGTPARRNKAAPAQRFPPPKPPRKTAKVVFDAPPAEPEEPRTFRLGAVPGATPGKWIDAWRQRMPHVPLELVPIDVADQRAALATLDAAIVRLPLADDTLHVIPLYEETPVVVAAIDSHLQAADELTLGDLAGEVVIPLSDDTLGPIDVPGAVTPRFSAMTTADAIATAAAGTGVVIVPMSLARLHHRKDVDRRPLVDGPTSTVGLAWLRDRSTDDVDTFVGIVRGRTANSSR